MDFVDDEMMQTAKQAARAAGAKLAECRGHVTGKLKGFRDFVSEADFAAESLILETIRTRFPEHSILSEEGGGKESDSSEYRWFIDPLDGTKNFLWGVPLSNVSVGLAYKGRIRLGVIYDPWRNELFWAQEGYGAYLNDQPIHVNDHSLLSESLVATDYDYTPARADLTAGLSRSLQTEVAGLRAFGSAALILAYVACGRVDAYFNYGVHPWDVAAGGLLITEAGGRMTNLNGEADYLQRHGCLGTNGLIHDEILKIWTRGGLIPLQLSQL